MSKKRLFRSKTDKYVAGVCGGLSDYFKMDPTIVRMLVVILAISSFGTMVIAYFITAVIVPERPTDYVDVDLETEGEETNWSVEHNTKQKVGALLIGAGALMLLSRLVNWFDSGMILAIGIIVVGAVILFKKNDN